MRTSLFLSSLFAVSLVGGVALADGSHTHDPGRAHGDTLDKTYRSPNAHMAVQRSVRTAEPVNGGARSPLTERSNQHINCAPDSGDCGSAAKHARPEIAQGTPAGATKNSMKNPFDQKEAERVNCNEGDQCTASSKASKAIWSKHSPTSARTTEASPTAVQASAAANRKDAQAPASRMSCNEGDDCTYSSKDAQKLWRTEAFKHGTESSSKDLAIENHQRLEKEKLERQKYEKPEDKQSKDKNRDAAHNPHPEAAGD